MKKLSALILAISICVAFTACSGRAEVEEDTAPASTTSETTTTEPVTSTMAPAKKDTKKGSELKGKVLSALGNKKGGALKGNIDYGSFEYEYKMEPTALYAYERSEELEQRATKNAQALVEKIKPCYNDEIRLDRMYPAQIGSGDNGIDSVRYEFYYINTQNQQLKIYAASDGEIFYAKCDFTW